VALPHRSLHAPPSPRGGDKTVEGQLRRLFDRYDVANRTELVRVAEREGWIAGP